jgi:hypothetical protein
MLSSVAVLVHTSDQNQHLEPGKTPCHYPTPILDSSVWIPANTKRPFRCNRSLTYLSLTLDWRPGNPVREIPFSSLFLPSLQCSASGPDRASSINLGAAGSANASKARNADISEFSCTRFARASRSFTSSLVCGL